MSASIFWDKSNSLLNYITIGFLAILLIGFWFYVVPLNETKIISKTTTVNEQNSIAVTFTNITTIHEINGRDIQFKEYINSQFFLLGIIPILLKILDLTVKSIKREPFDPSDKENKKKSDLKS